MTRVRRVACKEGLRVSLLVLCVLSIFSEYQALYTPTMISKSSKENMEHFEKEIRINVLQRLFGMLALRRCEASSAKKSSV